MLILATAVYIIDREKQAVLLAKKTRKIGVGKRFGYGGKVDEIDNGDPIACSIREVETETGGTVVLERDQLELVACIDFYNSEDKTPLIDDPIRVLYYRTFQSTQTPPSTEEMEDPKWFPLTDLPWATEMKAGDELFIPQVLTGALVKGYVWFTKDEKKVLGSEIKPCTLEDLVW